MQLENWRVSAIKTANTLWIHADQNRKASIPGFQGWKTWTICFNHGKMEGGEEGLGEEEGGGGVSAPKIS